MGKDVVGGKGMDSHMSGGRRSHGQVGLIASCFLSEALYTETRLQFDEAAKHLQKLEGTTRKAVCASVKDFNKSQVYVLRDPGLDDWRGG